MFKRGDLVPDWGLTDSSGQTHRLWDYRQKSHVILLYDPEARPETWQRWHSAIQADRKQWDWLNATVLILAKAPAEAVPGVYLIDRYGRFITYLPLDRWNFDDLEREFVYYEARHC